MNGRADQILELNLAESREDLSNLIKFENSLKESLRHLEDHIQYLNQQLEDTKKAKRYHAGSPGSGFDRAESDNRTALKVCNKWKKDILNCLNGSEDMEGYAVEYY